MSLAERTEAAIECVYGQVRMYMRQGAAVRVGIVVVGVLL